MQQHSSGQPPEKKLRVGGNYASGDPTNYDYQVSDFLVFFIVHFASSKFREIQINSNRFINNNNNNVFSLFIFIFVYTYYLFNSAFVV
jgi:hypothetical protein